MLSKLVIYLVYYSQIKVKHLISLTTHYYWRSLNFTIVMQIQSFGLNHILKTGHNEYLLRAHYHNHRLRGTTRVDFRSPIVFNLYQ